MPDIQKNAASRSLIYLTFLCLSLEIVRLSFNDNTKYFFLVWNLFLVWIPFWLTYLAQKFSSKSKFYTMLILMVWLLFFPNSPYIITDLLHLKSYSQKIIWFDSLLIFIFAATGFLVSLCSLQAAHQIFRAYLGRNKAWVLIVCIAFLSGFGIYLGRYCRLNSWDLFNEPIWFFGRIMHQFKNPFSYQITLLYGSVILLVYAIFNDANRKIASMVND